MPVKPEDALATFTAYETLIRRFPKHPKAAASRVIVAGMMERLSYGYYEQLPRLRALHKQLATFHGGDWTRHMLEVRAGIAAFYGNKQAETEMRRLLSDESIFEHIPTIAADALACIAPHRIKRANTLKAQSYEDGDEYLVAIDSGAKWEIELPPPPLYDPYSYVDGTLVWRSDLVRGAFITENRYPLWTIWVADLKAGRLRAFLPSKPLPDLKKTEKPLLVWSPDGKRLSCNGETFVVE